MSLKCFQLILSVAYFKKHHSGILDTQGSVHFHSVQFDGWGHGSSGKAHRDLSSNPITTKTKYNVQFDVSLYAFVMKSSPR
jgi:hypothetical protein